MWIGDIETDGLLPDCTKIHCAVFYNTDTKEWHEFTPKNISLLSEFLNKINTLCMHNGIGFDLKVFKQLLNFEFKGYYIDTLIMSRVLWPDIEKPSYEDKDGNKISVKGSHSVEAWGIRLGLKKPEHEDWSKFTSEMLHRCKEDVKIQTELYKKCINEIENYKRKDPRLNKWLDVFKLEMEFWKGMEKQAENGWLLDIDKCYQYIQQLKQDMSLIDAELDKILPPVVNYPYKDKVCIAFKKDGGVTTNATNWFARYNNFHYVDCEYFPPGLCGDFTRVEFNKLNLNSPEQVKDFLLKEGWIPKEYNFKKDKHNKPLKDNEGNLIYTTPKIPKVIEEWEQVAIETNSPTITLLADRNKIKHRLGMLQGFYENVRSDRRIEARMITCGTPTARATHICVVNVPKAEDGIFFGKECRSVFTAPEGKILVGADASALEARCEAHYLYKIDPSAAMLLIEGDIHTLNAEVWDVARRLAKNGKYALTYGCSASKLAATLFKPSEMSKRLYDDFWEANPALKELVRLLKEQKDARGYLVSVDGRPLLVRYSHAALNTLLQSAGAIVMKKAWCIFNSWRVNNTLSRYILDVGNFHDELQVETEHNLAEEVGEEIVKSIRMAGEELKFNVPLDGEYKIGKNWAETH